MHFLVTYCWLFLFFAALSVQAQQVFKTTPSSVIGYLEYVPPGYDANSEKYPLVIFLHGIGERGANSTDPDVLAASIDNVAKLGPPRFVKNGEHFPFMLVSPQLKNNYGLWTVGYVMEVINHVRSYLRVDDRRIYLTGLSLGGGGTWVGAQEHADLFAAIAPVCGGYNSPSLACEIAGENVPVWAFHGDNDTVVPMSRSTNMVNAINACSPKPNPLAKMTIYTGTGHDAWKYAYRTDHSIHNPNVYEWMMSFTNTVNGGNQIPTANAGPDINLAATSLTLTGSGLDSDGSITSYNWSLLSGPSTATLVDALTKSVTVLGLVSGDYMFRLQVEDNSGNVDSDYVKVTVGALSAANQPPVANAGDDKSITLPINYVSLFGSASDSDGAIESYLWTKVSGPSANMYSTTKETVKVNTMNEGTYLFRLTVKDEKGASSSDDVQVIVHPGNHAPTANAGGDQTIQLPTSTVSIIGAGTDPDGTVASYKWVKISGGSVSMSGISTSTLNVGGLAEGSYVFELTVTDNEGAKDNDDVTVTVVAANTPPVVNAGPDQTITLPINSVSISGTCNDADGTIAGYAWSKLSGGQATLNGASTPTLAASNLVEGPYVFRLRVTDNDGQETYDDVKVTVLKSAQNLPPTANAGPNRTINLPANSITIYGSATDLDGTVVSYSWTQAKGGSATLTGYNTPTLTVRDLELGSYYFRLTVTDDTGAEHSDMMLVNVKDGTASLQILPRFRRWDEFPLISEKMVGIDHDTVLKGDSEKSDPSDIEQFGNVKSGVDKTRASKSTGKIYTQG